MKKLVLALLAVVCLPLSVAVAEQWQYDTDQALSGVWYQTWAQGLDYGLWRFTHNGPHQGIGERASAHESDWTVRIEFRRDPADTRPYVIEECQVDVTSWGSLETSNCEIVFDSRPNGRWCPDHFTLSRSGNRWSGNNNDTCGNNNALTLAHDRMSMWNR